MSEQGTMLLERDLNPEKPRTKINYKEFKEVPDERIKNEIIVVSGMSPMKLWASQDWVDPKKISRLVLDRSTDNPEDGKSIEVPAYYYDMPTGQRAMIIADAHHRTLKAQAEGDKVDVKIIGPMPEGMISIPFSKFRRNAGRPF